MPLFGEPARFAVEYELNEDHGAEWLFGKVCFWIGGIRVGDFESGTSLRDVLFQFEERLKDAGRRQNARLFALPAGDFFAQLDRVLFRGGNASDESIANEEQWARHIFSPGVDLFDDWKMYLVENQERARLVWSVEGERTPTETILEAGECDRILEQATKELARIYESETRGA